MKSGSPEWLPSPTSIMTQVVNSQLLNVVFLLNILYLSYHNCDYLKINQPLYCVYVVLLSQ